MTSSKRPQVTILTTLEEDPHVNFFPWELDVRNAAASVCKAITPRGLLSLVLTDAQWNAYPANQIVNQAGQPAVAARFVPPAHIEVNDTMNSVTLYVSKASNDQLLDWINGEEALKTAIITSLGRVVSQVVRCPTNGFTLMSIMNILDTVRARYGQMQDTTRQCLEERMTNVLQATDTFDTHLSNLAQNFVISAIGGYPIDEDKQVKIFRASVSGNPLIAKALEAYGFDNPDSRTHTFANISNYVLLNLPNLQSSSRAAVNATANIMASDVYLTLEAENKKLKAEQANPRKRQGGKGKGKTKKQKKNRAKGDKTGEKELTKTLHYCHAHGSQHTHKSSECKLMAADKDRFTAAMRNAKDPEHPAGGSTKVLGQEPK